MPYAAVIAIMPGAAGANNILEDVAPHFANTVAKIRRRDGEWILESASFDACDSYETVYDSSKTLLSLIHSIFVLYIGWYESPLTLAPS
jgi:hypothetical protein